MAQHMQQTLNKEWDTLLCGADVPDIRNGADVFRAVRSDLRSMANALKTSFSLMVDNRHYSGSAARVSEQQIAELKTVAKVGHES